MISHSPGLEGDQRNPIRCPSIWRHGYSVMTRVHIANRHGEEESATTSEPPLGRDAG
jgi:hypothetical protein